MAAGLELNYLYDPFQLKLFYDSMMKNKKPYTILKKRKTILQLKKKNQKTKKP